LSYRRIYIASTNPHKIKELNLLFSQYTIEILSAPIPIPEDVENAFTLEENAFKKANFLFEKGYAPVISDDTGLFLPYLDGIPGVFSSRFSGEKKNYDENRKKLLEIVKAIPFEKRKAYFKTVICFIDYDGKPYFFTGTVEGFIVTCERGDNKFGYDPIFLYPPLGKTFGEIDIKTKNEISHRGKALKAFLNFFLHR